MAKKITIKSKTNKKRSKTKALQSKEYRYKAEDRKLFSSFITQINNAMKAKNVTRAELARRMNCNRAHITQIFRPKSNLTIKTMAQIGSALELSIVFSSKKKSDGVIVSGDFLPL